MVFFGSFLLLVITGSELNKNELNNLEYFLTTAFSGVFSRYLMKILLRDSGASCTPTTVSYTHLDVYKRQGFQGPRTL